jgi:hypothetical protein
MSGIFFDKALSRLGAVMGDKTDNKTSDKTGDRTFSGHRLAGSWLDTFQSVMGSRPHKPSFVVFDIGQSGGMLLGNWFRAHGKITFQEDILSQVVRFPRMSVYQHVRQSRGEVYGFNMTVEQLRQVQRLADPNQFVQDLHRGGCRVISINRRDALRHAIATLKTYSVNCRFDAAEPSARTRKFSDKSSGSKSSGKFTVDVSELIACLKYLDNQRVEASAILHEVPHLSLSYEDDLVDINSHEATAEKLSTYLNISKITPVGSPIKLVHQQLADIVVNYDALCEGLEASEYAYLLTDSRYLLTL